VLLKETTIIRKHTEIFVYQQTNYIAHWLLTYHLMPLLSSTSNAQNNLAGSVRIVNLAAPASVFAPPEGITFDDIDGVKGTPLTRYGMSKCGNILHIMELNRQYGPDAGHGKGIWTASLHPGAWIT
jgi:NAD(P)-dependent dehydrogenase (short-subunit alcohol dehydrogenase family)